MIGKKKNRNTEKPEGEKVMPFYISRVTSHISYNNIFLHFYGIRGYGAAKAAPPIQERTEK